MSQSPLQQECGLADAHSRSKGVWGMCYSSSGNCMCSLWHRTLMNLVLKIVSRCPAANAETGGESAFSSCRCCRPSHPALLPHFRAMWSLSFHASLFCLLAVSALEHRLEVTPAWTLPGSCMAPPATALQKTKNISSSRLQLSLPRLPAVAGFVLFPVHKVCKHECRPQQFCSSLPASLL